MYELEFEELDELISKFEELASESELEAIDKECLKKCGQMAYKEVKKKMNVSSNHSLSGIQHAGGVRETPSSHAKDAVPLSGVRKRKGKQVIIVGWEKNKAEDYEYYNFVEWGTSKMPPNHAFGGTNRKLFKKYEEVFIREYDKRVKELEG